MGSNGTRRGASYFDITRTVRAAGNGVRRFILVAPTTTTDGDSRPATSLCGDYLDLLTTPV